MAPGGRGGSLDVARGGQHITQVAPNKHNLSREGKMESDGQRLDSVVSRFRWMSFVEKPSRVRGFQVQADTGTNLSNTGDATCSPGGVASLKQEQHHHQNNNIQGSDGATYRRPRPP